MYRYIHALSFIPLAMVGFVINTTPVKAQPLYNPCDPQVIQQLDKLDVGDDPNFQRIKQEKNRDIIRACQDYEVKKAEELRNDWNRDNY